jgi:hypothetical protein
VHRIYIRDVAQTTGSWPTQRRHTAGRKATRSCSSAGRKIWSRLVISRSVAQARRAAETTFDFWV